MNNQLIKSAILILLALSSTSVWAHGQSHMGNYASVCPTLVQQYEDSIPGVHKNAAKLVKTKDLEVRTLFLS